MAFVALALAVFGWGTSYKLSLYHSSDSHSHELTPAKLLTSNEQSSRDKLESTGLTAPRHNGAVETELVLFLAVLLGFVPRTYEYVSPHAQPLYDFRRHPRRNASLNFFFELPPPALA
jgi:hypothetical protein